LGQRLCPLARDENLSAILAFDLQVDGVASRRSVRLLLARWGLRGCKNAAPLLRAAAPVPARRGAKGLGIQLLGALETRIAGRRVEAAFRVVVQDAHRGGHAEGGAQLLVVQRVE